MSKLKKVGRNVRRIRASIAKMHPEKLYTISGDGKGITLTGAQWKASTRKVVLLQNGGEEHTPV
jgi:hypothetical protein